MRGLFPPLIDDVTSVKSAWEWRRAVTSRHIFHRDSKNSASHCIRLCLSFIEQDNSQKIYNCLLVIEEIMFSVVVQLNTWMAVTSIFSSGFCGKFCLTCVLVGLGHHSFILTGLISMLSWVLGDVSSQTYSLHGGAYHEHCQCCQICL